MLRIFLIALASFAAASDAAAAEKYTWEKHAAKPGEWMLFRCDGVRCTHVGNYNETDAVFRNYLGGNRWGPDDCPPCDLPAEVQAKFKGKETAEPPKVGATADNFGINVDAVKNYTGPAYSVAGRACTREQALAKLGALNDDATKPFLTLIGPKADTDRVRADIDASHALQIVRDNWRVQAFEPDAPMLAGCGFVTDGKPTIYMQAPDGQVVHRQANYAGPEALAEAARKADPRYDPAKDPDLTKRNEPPASAGGDLLNRLNQVPGWAWGLGAGILVVLLARSAPAKPASPSIP